MFDDQLNFRPKYNPMFRSMCMKSEGDPGGDPPADPPGGGEGHFTDKYPSLKGNATLTRYKTEEESHTAHLEARKTISSPYRLPKSMDSLTDEQKAAFNGSMAELRGIPKTAADYVVNAPEDVPDAIKFKEEHQNAAKEICKKYNIPQVALQELSDLQYNMVKGSYEAKQKANETAADECVSGLKELWAGEYGENIILVERYIRSLVNPKWASVEDAKDEKWQNFRTTIYNSQVGNNPIIMQAILPSAQKAIAEGKVLPGITKKREKPASTDREQWKKENPSSPYPGD